MAKWTPEAATAAEQRLRDYRDAMEAAVYEARRRAAEVELARLEARTELWDRAMTRREG